MVTLGGLFLLYLQFNPRIPLEGIDFLGSITIAFLSNAEVKVLCEIFAEVAPSKDILLAMSNDWLPNKMKLFISHSDGASVPGSSAAYAFTQGYAMTPTFLSIVERNGHR
jgi:hypothetical protein